MKNNFARTIFIFLFAVSAFFISTPIKCLSANFSDVVINEISWMGTTASANDEWIELYNNSDSPIIFDGWTLIAEDGAPKDIKLTGSVLVKDFYLLERTDDNSAPNATADLIYTGTLENSGEVLELYDNFGNQIDKVNCKDGWLAGDNKTKQTMERIENNSWQTSKDAGGTPKQKNSEGKSSEIGSLSVSPAPQSIIAGTTPPPTPISTPSPAPLAPIIYPDGIIFNEILPSPEGADAENEWIEIFNQNNSAIDLSGWKIKDSKGTVVTYSFPTSTKIIGLGYLVISRKESKITLNNDEDSLTLTRPDGKTADTISFEKAPLGQSYNKTKSDWQWSGSLTPGAKNFITNLSAETTNKSSSADAKIEQSDGVAALAENLPNTEANRNKNILVGNNLKSYIPAVVIALFIAISSSIAILFLKKKLSIEK